MSLLPGAIVKLLVSNPLFSSHPSRVKELEVSFVQSEHGIPKTGQTMDPKTENSKKSHLFQARKQESRKKQIMQILTRTFNFATVDYSLI